MSDGPSPAGPKPSVLYGRTSEVMTALLTSGGGATAAIFHADLVVLIVAQVPVLAHLAMRWTRQRHEQLMQRRVQEQHQKITDAALEDPSNPDLRTLMEDHTRTSPCRNEPCSGRRREPAADAGSAGTDDPQTAEAPPPPTPIDRSA